ncbi:peptidase M24, structural domain-containing protein [Phakopsora pachyrhizi]|uniref:Methionine aminopeptidase n=1 Tax=Phakopsora pachyrhizi TaxID=170000 RepID=A0AAV0AJ13_PHAPC|nr:peptidase M24, structural domain-containing protein [Phakopsora pachyrhizi]CAH7667988.1 peptidase M24, structural domain-containing protein [Phakopsora pachyrhizi]CAH7668446.1 peptidase M24, structural domain-containing protein [Phakopsora pachyrhizi]
MVTELTPRPCSTPGCAKLASSLECPRCKDDPELLSRFFCDQICFKGSWLEHKALYHSKVPKPIVREDYSGPESTYDPFDSSNLPQFHLRNKSQKVRESKNFKYTGQLRAFYPIENVRRRSVPNHILLPDYVKDVKYGASPCEQAVSGHRLGKPLQPDDIEGMRKVCKLAREVLDLASSHVRPGITTLELDKIVHDACIERDSYPSPLGYYLFPRSVCTSVNEVICHGIPDARPLEEGDIVNLDVTLYHAGYHGDLNATYPVGKISKQSEHLIKQTRRCLDRAIAICRPGTLIREVGNVIEPMAKKAGLNVNKRYCGHGISQLFHGPPNIPHYSKSKAIGEMKPGMIFTIEPMVNEGVSDEDHWPDNWTAVTRDGKRSAQFEETLLITENGVEVLTAQAGWKLPEEFRGLALGTVKGAD